MHDNFFLLSGIDSLFNNLIANSIDLSMTGGFKQKIPLTATTFHVYLIIAKIPAACTLYT